MADIKTIHQLRPAVPECVEYLKKMLALAESGEIMHVAVVAQYYDRAIGSGWSTADNVYRTSMLGGIEALKLDYYEQVVKG